MLNLTKLNFGDLDISKKNYLTWVLDAEIGLNAEDHSDNVKEENPSSN